MANLASLVLATAAVIWVLATAAVTWVRGAPVGADVTVAPRVSGAHSVVGDGAGLGPSL